MTNSRDGIEQLLHQLESLYRDALELDYEVDRRLARGDTGEQLRIDLELLEGRVIEVRRALRQLRQPQHTATDSPGG